MKKVIAIDFDGTLFENKWPEIGMPIAPNINRAKNEKANGAVLILWTCREGEKLAEALAACKAVGLKFDYVNENADELKAAFGWTDKQLDEISCEVEELDVINDLYEVTGISMDDVSGEEIPCKKAPIGFTYAGMRLLVLRDERGGIAGINERQMEPIMDELKNGQYMVWYRRTMSNGNPYYVLKCGMYLRMAVLPIVFDDVFAAALDEIRAGLATAAAIRQQMRREDKENDG